MTGSSQQRGPHLLLISTVPEWLACGLAPQQTRLREQVGHESMDEAPGKGARVTLPAPREGKPLVLALFYKGAAESQETGC